MGETTTRHFRDKLADEAAGLSARQSGDAGVPRRSFDYDDAIRAYLAQRARSVES
jgi:hypothetical protein